MPLKIASMNTFANKYLQKSTPSLMAPLNLPSLQDASLGSMNEAIAAMAKLELAFQERTNKWFGMALEIEKENQSISKLLDLARKEIETIKKRSLRGAL